MPILKQVKHHIPYNVLLHIGYVIAICSCLLLGVFGQSMQVKANEVSGYEEAHHWLVSIGYTEEMLSDRTQDEILKTSEHLRTKQEKYGKDIVVKVTNYPTYVRKNKINTGNQISTIEPEELRLDNVYINYELGDTIVGVEVDIYYKWLSKPMFLSEDDEIFLTWDATMFMVPSADYVNYTSTAALKPNGKTVKALLNGQYVGHLSQGEIGWSVSLSYPSLEVEYYSGRAFVSLQPIKTMKAGEKNDSIFTLQYAHRASPAWNAWLVIIVLVLGVLAVMHVLHRRGK